jgi:hypothetical protein
MKETIVNILLALSALIWVSCILIYLSLQLHYTRRQSGFLKKMLLGSLKLDYTAGSEDMSRTDRRLYIFSFIGIFVFFLPGGYFIGFFLHKYLTKS